MTTRQLAAKDKPAWLRLFVGYNDFYHARVAPEVVESLWQRLMRGAPGDHVGLVAIAAEFAWCSRVQMRTPSS